MRNLHELIEKDKYDAGGRCSSKKGEVIKELILQNNFKLCVEIGVFKGASLMYFAEALEITKGQVFGIDPYSMGTLKNEIPNSSLHNYIYDVLFNDQKVLDNLYLALEKIIAENDLRKTIHLTRAKSEDYYSNFKEESIDILHIDGNHDEEYVTKDVLLYLPLVKKGGYIIMDDIQWPGVSNTIIKHLNNSSELIKKYEDFSIHKKR